MADIDAELQTALKLAKSKEMFFCFVPKGAEGKLIVSKKKIPPKEIAALRKEIGGGNPVIGKCIGPIGEMVFKVAKASATLGAAIKKVAKRDSGLTVVPDVQVAADIEAEMEAAEEAGTAPVPPPAPPKPATPPPPKAPPKPNLGPWQAARDKAIKELKDLAKKVFDVAKSVPGAKETSAEVVKEIQDIITKLPANPKPQEFDKLVKLIETDDGISAAEEAPKHFHVMAIRKPLLDALQKAKEPLTVA